MKPAAKGPLAVLCEGPSILEAVIPEGVAQCAINMALSKWPLADIWAMKDPIRRYVDPPNDTCPIPDVTLGLKVEVWVDITQVERAAAAWPNWAVSSLTEDAYATMRWGYALNTFSAAVMTACQRGYDPILCYGVDWRGTGSPLTPWQPWTEEEDEHQSRRWDRERGMFEHIQTVAKQRFGTTIECVGAEDSACTPKG